MLNKIVNLFFNECKVLRYSYCNKRYIKFNKFVHFIIDYIGCVNFYKILFKVIECVNQPEKYTVKTIVYILFNIKYTLRTKDQIENGVFDN